ncbi:hypothetical protein Agub_g1859, partial [Astrephomene gubernaculifera]
RIGWCSLKDSGAAEPAGGGIQRLLDRLPASLRELVLCLHSPLGPRTKVTVEFDPDGCFNNVSLSEGAVLISAEECTWLARMLLSNRAARGRQLGCLRVWELTVKEAVLFETPEQLQPLRELAGRFAGVELKSLRLCGAKPDTVTNSLATCDVLGIPEQVRFAPATQPGPSLGIRLRGPGVPAPLAPPQPAAPAQLQPASPQQKDQHPTPAADVAAGLFRRLAAARGRMSCFMMLHGPFMEILLELQEPLTAFLRSLEEPALPLVGGDSGSSRPFVAYQRLPAASALLVECCNPNVLAVTAVSAEAMVKGGHKASALQVVPLKMKSETYMQSSFGTDLYKEALQQELEAMWGDAGARRLWGDREWLRQLLQAGGQLGELPPAVKLQAA